MEELSSAEAPDSIGPFSQGIKTDGLIFVSGQGPVDPETGEIVGETAREQTLQTLANIEAVLKAADRSLDDVVKATVFLTDMSLYDAVNEAYGEQFSSPYPARSAVEVEELPIDIMVEIEVIAEA